VYLFKEIDTLLHSGKCRILRFENREAGRVQFKKYTRYARREGSGGLPPDEENVNIDTKVVPFW
jgi:hypothetical protein